MMGNTFSRNLRIARINAGFTQEYVANHIGVATSTYSLYENGRREPNIDKIKMLADLLGVTGNNLLGIDDEGNDLGVTATLTNHEEEMLDKYRAIPMEKRRYIDLFINALYAEVSP